MRTKGVSLFCGHDAGRDSIKAASATPSNELVPINFSLSDARRRERNLLSA